MKNFIIFLILFSIGYSCKNVKNEDVSIRAIFNLKDPPKITNVKLTDLRFVDIEYIPTETLDSSLFTWYASNILGSTGRLRFGNEFFIVKSGNNVLIFKGNGLFQKKIGKIGRGPDEYTVAHDIQINEITQEIYILAGWQQKFFVYSNKGDLIRTFKIPFFCNEFIFVEDGILCYSENHMANIETSYNLIDTNGSIVKSYPNKYPFQVGDGYVFRGENLFYQFKGQIFKKEVYSDTVYLCKNREFKPTLVIDVGDRLITPEARSQLIGMDLAKKYISPLNLFEFGNYIFYEFMYKFDFSNTEYYSFIGAVNNDFHVLFSPYHGITNDIDGGPNMQPKTIGDDNSIATFVDALQLKKHIASDAFKNSTPKYPEKKKELEKLAASLKETDNPVLVLVSLKK